MAAPPSWQESPKPGAPASCCLLGPPGGRGQGGRERGLAAKVPPALGRQQLPARLSSCSETNEPANSAPSTGMTKPEGDFGHSSSARGLGRGLGRHSTEPGGREPDRRMRLSSRKDSCAVESPAEAQIHSGVHLSFQGKHRPQSPGLADPCQSGTQSPRRAWVQIWDLENTSLST